MNIYLQIIVVTEDSAINVYDYNQKKEFLSRKFYAKATCINIAFQNCNFKFIITLKFIFFYKIY